MATRKCWSYPQLTVKNMDFVMITSPPTVRPIGSPLFRWVRNKTSWRASNMQLVNKGRLKFITSHYRDTEVLPRWQWRNWNARKILPITVTINTLISYIYHYHKYSGNLYLTLPFIIIIITINHTITKSIITLITVTITINTLIITNNITSLYYKFYYYYYYYYYLCRKYYRF